jgi:hypothetical protein
MNRLLATATLVLLALAACDRSPSEGGGPIVLVQLAPDGRVLGRGETLTLELTVRDAGGEQPSEATLRGIAWASDDRSVATVEAGVVTGIAPGSATIRAELDGVSGSVRVAVADPAAGCDAEDPLGGPPVGGSWTVQGVEGQVICLPGGETGRDYALVPFHGSASPAGYAAVLLRGQGTVVPGPLPALDRLAPARTAAGRPRDDDFHRALRLRAEREIPTRASAAAPVVEGPLLALELRSPSVGQEVRINTALASCDSARMRTGRIVAVGTRSVVVADLQNPVGGLTDAEYASFGAAFDTLVWPVVTTAFGEPRDVDGNGRVVLFYTRAVNELTPPGSGAYIGGYFHPRDLFPVRTRDGISGCATSNVAEMFYMMAADPQGTVNGNVFSRTHVLEKSLGTVAHEFQHLINASRRLYVVRTSHWNEETWLNEALSHATEELVFHRASGLAPRQNIAAVHVQFGRAGLAYRSFQEENLRRYGRFLEELETQSPYDASTSGGDHSDLATRGAGWAFLRYAADRLGADDGRLWRSLVDGSTTGLANLQHALGVDPRPWVRDWLVSVLVDDLVPGVHPRHTQPSWHFRSFHTPFPARVRILGTGDMLLQAKAGSGAFVRVGVPPGTIARVSATSAADLALPSAVSVTIVRTR